MFTQIRKRVCWHTSKAVFVCCRTLQAGIRATRTIPSSPAASTCLPSLPHAQQWVGKPVNFMMSLESWMSLMSPVRRSSCGASRGGSKQRERLLVWPVDWTGRRLLCKLLLVPVRPQHITRPQLADMLTVPLHTPPPHLDV